MAQAVQPVQLKAETTQQFAAYIRAAEAEMVKTEHESGPFLFTDQVPSKAEEVRKGKIIAQYWSGSEPVEIADGLIHDLVGVVRIPTATLDSTLSLIQDYDNHKNIYKPEVLDSKLLNRKGDQFRIYLRLLKKKIITVVLDTEHQVRYYPVGRERWCCWSHTTLISEVEHHGSDKEKVLPPDTGYGFLWRLQTYWRFQGIEADVWVECRAISLSRDVPQGLGWIIDPIIRKLPKDSLMNTLKATRQALQ